MHKFWILAPIFLAGCQAGGALEDQAPPAPIIAEEPVLAEPVIILPPKPRFVIDNIMNLAPDTLENILGTPSLKRTEKDVRVWLYQNAECILHLYFYPNENGDFRLDYVEAAAADLTSDNPTVSANACLDSFVVATGDQPLSSLGTDTGPQPDRLDN